MKKYKCPYCKEELLYLDCECKELFYCANPDCLYAKNNNYCYIAYDSELKNLERDEA